MTVADPAGDAPAAGDRDGLPRRGFRRLAEQGPGLLEGPVPSQSLQPLTPVPSPGNDLLKLRWKPEVRVGNARPPPAPLRRSADGRTGHRPDRLASTEHGAGHGAPASAEPPGFRSPACRDHPEAR